MEEELLLLFLQNKLKMVCLVYFLWFSGLLLLRVIYFVSTTDSGEQKEPVKVKLKSEPSSNMSKDTTTMKTIQL